MTDDSEISPLLEGNLRALAAQNRALAERLLLPVGSDHVLLDEEGGPRLTRFGGTLPLGVEEPVARESVRAIPVEATSAFVLGVGLGELVQALLEDRPGVDVVAWDRDPWLLRVALSHHDWSAAIESGQLRLALGVDLVDATWSVDRVVLEHPTLAAVYRDERTIVEGRSAGLPESWAALGTGGLFVDDVADALRERGYGVFPIELTRWSEEEIRHALRRLHPELLCAINYTNGLNELCLEERVPLVVWEIDPTPDRAPRLSAPTDATWLFTYRQAHVGTHARAGFEHVDHLPLAANPLRRRPIPRSEYEEDERLLAPVCFVGSSMVVEAHGFRREFLRWYGAWHADGEAVFEEADRKIQEVLDAQRTDYSMNRIPELARAHFGDFLAAAESSWTTQDPLVWLSEIAAAEKRLAYVAELGSLGIRVWGDSEWSAVEPFGARYMGSAGHDRELTLVYNGATVNVDVNRLYQPDIVTMRVFDVLACGGFLIAEYSDDLAELFSLGEEVESFRTLDELRAKVEHFLAHPGQARAIAERGQAAVRERHTIAGRVDTMLSRCFGSGQKAAPYGARKSFLGSAR